MPTPSEKTATTVSTKGQVILPKLPGTRLTVENTPEGVLLKPAPVFSPTQLDAVFGSLAHSGKAVTLEEMDAAVAAEARRRARD